MNVNLSAQQIGAWLTRAAYTLGVVTSITNTFNLPTSLRVAIAFGSAIVFGIDRFVTDPTTGTGPTPTASPPTSTTKPTIPPS
jgi:hypothetical protein